MKLEISVEEITPDSDKPLDYVAMLAMVALRLRRAKWFDYARRRFDLICLGKIADWCGRTPGGVTVNADLRADAETALFDSISLGEFGAGDWPSIAWMQQGVPIYNQGNFPLRLSAGQIAHFRKEWPNLIGDLWAPRGLCARWLKARGISPPPWLPPGGTEAAPATDPQPAAGTPTEPKVTEPAPKRPFDREGAAYLLAGMKRGGTLDQRPTPAEAQAILDRTFDHSPRDPVVGIIRKLWGEGKRGPRNPRNRSAKP